MKTRASALAARSVRHSFAKKAARRATPAAAGAPAAFRKPPITGPAVTAPAALAVRAPGARAPRALRPRTAPKTDFAAHGSAALGALGTLVQNPLVWIAAGAGALFLHLQKKQAITVESGKKYRYETVITPALSPEATTELQNEIAEEGNESVRVTPTAATYDVTRATPATLTPGQVIATFGGSNVVFQSATRVA